MENIKYFSSVKSQDVKFNAFFHYLKSFSQAAVDTLFKLQSQFNKQMFKDRKDSEKLCTIKNLLQAYQIFILQVKDSCDFVEISEFGFCIGKTFMQLMKIIKWTLKQWIKDSKSPDKLAKALEKTDRIETDKTLSGESNNICSFCEQIIRTSPVGKQMSNQRKGIAGGIGQQFREAKRVHINERSHLIDYKSHVIERFTMKQIESKRCIFDNQQLEILNRKQQTLKMQISNGQNVLQQILNEFNVKNESIARFVINSQASFMEDARANEETDFNTFEQKMKELIHSKFTQANQKIKELTKMKLRQYQAERRKKQIGRQVQTSPLQANQSDKYDYRLRKLSSQLQKLRNELSAQKDLTQSLNQLLQSKSIQFQEEFLSYRKDLIMENKQKIFLKSLKSFKDVASKTGDQKTEENHAFSIKQQIGSSIISYSKLSNSKLSIIANRDKNMRKKLRNQIKFTFQEGCQEENQQNMSFLAANNNYGFVEGKKIHSYTWNEADNWVDKYSKTDIRPDIINSESQISEELKGKTDANTQTDQLYLFTASPSRDDKIICQSRKSVKMSKSKQKSNCINLYSNVKSRVYNIVPRVLKPRTVKQISKEVVQTLNPSTQHLLVKKLIQVDEAEGLSADVVCYKIKQEPIFTAVKKIMISRQDIVDLFVNQINAKNYECLLYRNQIFNLSNINQKRVINNTIKMQQRPLTSCPNTPKKDILPHDSLETKIVKCLYYQMGYIRKRQRIHYDLLKCILRSPYKIMKKIQFTQLLSNNENLNEDPTIEYGQLKRMIQLMLKFHEACMHNRQDMICVHLAGFCQKIGIKLHE